MSHDGSSWPRHTRHTTSDDARPRDWPRRGPTGSAAAVAARFANRCQRRFRGSAGEEPAPPPATGPRRTSAWQAPRVLVLTIYDTRATSCSAPCAPQHGGETVLAPSVATQMLGRVRPPADRPAHTLGAANPAPGREWRDQPRRGRAARPCRFPSIPYRSVHGPELLRLELSDRATAHCQRRIPVEPEPAP
jgi:hypothetical protein